jgi:PadR family transcriptional regulator, regulatory protein AphA
MKLRAPSYLMLGMLRLGATSGYAIKKATDLSTRFFWPTSLAQVYPELAALDEAGLVSREDDPQGARARSSYQTTPAGDDALRAWLRSPKEAPSQFRDEGVLKLFFADALPAEDQATLVRRLRERAEATERHMRDEIAPLAEAFRQQGIAYPEIVANLGADTHAFVANWLARLEAQIEDT